MGPSPVTMKLSQVWFENGTDFYQEGYRKGRVHIALSLPAQDHASLRLLASSNTVRELFVESGVSRCVVVFLVSSSQCRLGCMFALCLHLLLTP